MKIVRNLAIFAVLFIAACYLVPEFPEYPKTQSESIDEIKLNATGDRLLVRTQYSDFDFALPNANLSAALAPLKHSAPIKPSDTPWYAQADLADLQIKDDGSFGSRLTVTFIGYDPEIRPTDIGLPRKEIARLGQYGFVPSKNPYSDDFNAVWVSNVVGQRHDHNTLGTWTGADLVTCCGSRLDVILDTPEKIEHNRRLNARLAPLTVVTHAVKSVIADCGLLIFLLLGGKLGLPRG
ncbi:hypothetical protein [Paraburkholderia bannensis]|uniref:hypothetical protein n=1 Tax=Paraburkholderia bannensis TaxID=765414 RepID=UPI002AC343F2|nr:hypothetical protein [Paraburkholderia bannensis]